MSVPPKELSLAEIRDFMLNNGGKVTNHALVKHFKKFLTDQRTQHESRKNFKTFVNILATSRPEGNEKYLILRKRYFNECPSEDNLSMASGVMSPMSPGSRSTISESDSSPLRIPPPYRPPPEVSGGLPTGVPDSQSNVQYRDCVDEFKNALSGIRKPEVSRQNSVEKVVTPQPKTTGDESPMLPPRKRSSIDRPIPRDFSIDQTYSEPSPVREKTPFFEGQLQSPQSPSIQQQPGPPQFQSPYEDDNKISVKEAMMKFNRIASEEEAKITSPPGKNKKPEKASEDKENMSTESLTSHVKAKEWIVSAARCNYQELAKLAVDYPELAKLQDTATTALHWAAKHGNADVVKLIAGTYKCNVNTRTNGGYTPLHIAMQFERDNIFDLLFNVYKADRDMVDWSGKKPHDYRKQKTSVSASTYSKIKARKKHSEKDLGFLRIGSLNVRVKKTTEAFSNFLGVGNNNSSSSSTNNPMMSTINNSNLNQVPLNVRTSAPPNSTYFEKIHKNWGSADNIPIDGNIGGVGGGVSSGSAMPPPKYGPIKKNRSKRGAAEFGLLTVPNQAHSQSVPSTPNQIRAPIGTVSENPLVGNLMNDSDSDSAYGFDSAWNGVKKDGNQRPTYI